MNRRWIPLLLMMCVSGASFPPGAIAATAPSSTSVSAVDADATGSSNEAEDQYLFATELFGKKMYQLAVQQYEKFADNFPRHPKAFQARLRIGEALFRLGQYDRSVEAYEKALALQPESNFKAEALVGMGLALFNQKNYTRAASTLGEAQKLTDNDKTLGPVAANWLGEALFAGERYAEAIAAYQSVSKWPQSTQAPQAMYSIGFCQLKLGQKEPAAETFRKVALQYGDSPVAAEAALRAGDVLRREKQFKAAAQQYEFILQKYGTGEYAADAQVGLASTRYAQGDFTGARAAFQIIQAKYPQSKAATLAPLRIGDCYYSEKKYAEAAGAYAEAARSSSPETAAEATYWLGMSRLEMKSAAEASVAFETLASRYPHSPFAQRGQVRLAEALAQQGKTDAALAAYAKAEALNPGSPAAETAAYARGILLYSAKRVPEAGAQFRQFMTQYPKSAHASASRLALAQCQFEGKEFGQAATTLQPFTAPGAATGDTLAAAWFLLGQCQSRLNKPDAAVTAFKASVDAAPQGTYAPRALAALGSIYTARGMSREAGDTYAQLSRKYPEAPQAGDAVLRAADAAREAGRMDEAVRLYSQVIEQKSKPTSLARARLGLAQAYSRTGKTDLAAHTLDELFSSKPPADIAVSARFVAGEIQEKAGHLAEAVRAYETVLTLQPRPEVAAASLLRIGTLRDQQQQYGPAAEALNRLVERYPKSNLVPDALYELGWSFIEQKQTTKARPYFERLIAEFPANELSADAAFRVAEADYGSRQFGKAVERYRLAATAPAGKDLADKAWYKLGWCYREMKEYSLAAEAFLKVPAQFPQSDLSTESRLRGAEALLAENQPRQALAQFTQVMQQTRGKKDGAALLPRAQMGVAECRIKLGEVDAGIAVLRQVAVTSNGPVGCEAQSLIGDTFFERNDFKAARDEYLRATLLFAFTPKAAYAEYRLGQSYLKLGDKTAANGAFRKVIDGWSNTYWADRARQALPGGRAEVPEAPARTPTASVKTIVPSLAAPHRKANVVAPASESGNRTVIPPPPTGHN